MRPGRASGADWLRLGEAAAALGVSLNTVRRWSDADKLTCYRSPGGHRRFRRRDVEALLRRRSGPEQASAGRAEPAGEAASTDDVGALRARLTALARVATQGIGVTTCRFSVATADGGARILTTFASPDGDPGGSPATPSTRPSPAGAKTLRTGARLVIGDLTATSRLSLPEAEDQRTLGDVAVLAVPLDLQKGLSGVMELCDTRGPRSFSGADIAFAEFIARQASRSITGEPDGSGAAFVTQSVALREQLPGLLDTSPENDETAAVYSVLRTVRQQAAVAACTVYEVTDGLATPILLEESIGLPAHGGASWVLSDYPLAAEAAATGTPVAAEAGESRRLSPLGAAQQLEARDLAAVVLAPLVFQDTLVGLLELGVDAPDLLPEVLRLAGVSTAPLAIALGSARIMAGLRRRCRDLSLVLEASFEDASRRSTKEVLHAVSKRLSELTHTPVVDIYSLERDALRALVSYDGGRHDTEWEGVVLSLQRYPCSAKAVETGEIAVVASLDDPLLVGEGRGSLEKWGYQSQASMPLVSGGRVIGLIELSDYAPRDFAVETDLIRGLGHVAAHALENAALFEQVENRNRVLNDLVDLGSISSGARDLDALARQVAERLLVAVDAASCDVYRVGDKGPRCVASFDRSGHDEAVIGTLLTPAEYPTLVRAMNGQQVLVITSPDDPQLTETERRVYREYGFASEVAIPLVVNDELLGLLDIYDTRERDYTEYLSFLRNAAQTLAGAFETALLFDQLERRSVVLHEVIELSAVASQARDLGRVLTAIAERLRDTVDAADCDIFTLQEDKLRCLVSVDRSGVDAAVAGRVLDMDRFPATAMAVRTRRPMTIASLADPRLTTEEREDMSEYGYQSELCIPLVSGERVIGIVDVFDTRPRDFGEHLDFLRSVGQTAAGAIENALLLDELERRNAALAELVELGKMVSGAGGITALARAVGPRVVDVMDADGCRMFILQGGELRRLLSYDNGAFDDDPAEQALDLDLLPSTRDCIEQKAALIIESPDDPRLGEHERRLYRESGTQSEIRVPLVLDDRVIGLLGVHDHRRRDYAEHRDFLLSVGGIVAGAFENALLLDRLEDGNRTLGLLVESGLEFGASLELEEVLESVARRLCEAATAPNCDIFTIIGERLHCVCSLERGVTDPEYVGTEYPLAQLGLASAALASGEPRVATDIADDPHVSELERHEDLGWGHRAMLELPLINRGEVIGLAVISDDHPRDFEGLDYLHSLAQVAAGALANAELYADIKRMHLNNLRALSSALNAKDYYTLGHAARVAAYMVLLGEELGWDEETLRRVEEVAYLHDIGKIGVSDRVLLKPSGLNGPEWDLMRQHPIFSADIIRPLFDEALVAGVRHHHERWDGEGYPDGLRGEAIPEVARAMCVADSYDAMSFLRPYRQALDYEECLDELERCRGSQFDPRMIDAFRRVLERIRQGRRFASAVAVQAAAAIDAGEFRALRRREDESHSAHAAVTRILREVTAASPPTGRMAAFTRHGHTTLVVADSRPDGPDRPHLGDEAVADDELAEVLSGRAVDANVLAVDQWGVWISGVAPIVSDDGDVVGVVSAEIPATGDSPDVEGLRSNVAQTLASMLHSAALRSTRMELEAITDGLTGLYNHRYFHERLGEEIERCLEKDTSLSLLFCDLDGFRAFNDRHGHGSGDRVLRAVARVLESSVRHVDLTARYGGEEFAAILVDTPLEGAVAVAERIRSGIARTQSAAGADALSVSIGVAGCPGDATCKEELVDKADWAMYAAKRRGGDAVMTFDAEHGASTPEQASLVGPGYVTAMGDLVAAREAYRQRRRSTISRIALAVGREVDAGTGALRAALATGEPGGRAPGSREDRIVALATAFEALVAEHPYRSRISEAEALEELLDDPLLEDDRELARAFERVLSG